MSQTVIFGSPAFSNESQNPYNALLYRHLDPARFTVEEFSFGKLLLGRADIWHIHWPEWLIHGNTVWRRCGRLAGFCLALVGARLRGVKIVWTVHNLLPHDKPAMSMDHLAYRCMIHFLEGYISLSASAQKLALAEYPALARKRAFIIPHGHYKGVYPDHADRGTARRRLGLPDEVKLYVFMGAVRPYKNIEGLIAQFRRIPDPDSRLLIAGRAANTEYAAALKDLACADPRILFELRFVEPVEVQYILRAADVVVLPFQQILNSGSALLALSFDRPIVVPRLGSLVDLERLCGGRWVHTYAGDLSTQVLEEAMSLAGQLTDDDNRCLAQSLQAVSWTRIGSMTATAYDTLLGKPNTGCVKS